MKTLLKNIKVYAETEEIENGYLLIEEGKIKEYGSYEACPKDEAVDQTLSFQGEHSVLPGFIDVHIHGANGADTMDGAPEALEKMAEALPREGTTSFLATTMTSSSQAIEKALENVSTYKKRSQRGKAEVVGVHLEGPFISPNQIGAQHPDHVQKPSVSLFKRWQALAEGHIKLVTLAPEEEGGIELVEYLHSEGVMASIGHSHATYEQAVGSFKAGVKHATHLFNQMRAFHHREPGVVGAVLLHDDVKAELIVDGIHSHPKSVQLAFQNKGSEGLLLVTDAMRAKCLHDGVYDLGGQDVIVQNHKATLADGTLAGSIIRLRDAAKNMMTFTHCSVKDIVQMASVNPAKQIGVYNQKGSIREGKDADLVVVDGEFNIVMTICRGEVAYSSN